MGIPFHNIRRHHFSRCLLCGDDHEESLLELNLKQLSVEFVEFRTMKADSVAIAASLERRNDFVHFGFDADVDAAIVETKVTLQNKEDRGG